MAYRDIMPNILLSVPLLVALVEGTPNQATTSLMYQGKLAVAALPAFFT